MEKMLGVMLDCSRNAVMKVETVKRYAQILKKMGYNTLMLYTEDTYEIPSQPYFGHLRGRYSMAELKEMDAYCNSIGIELVPCVQMLAHLQAMFKWEVIYKDIKDCDDILLIGEEKTYELIEDMFKTLSECFTTRKIHIGMDEAYRVGSGEYQKRNGIRDRFDIINEHLHKVCDIAAKYNMEPMIWSDMFVKLASGLSGNDTYYGEADTAKILEKAALPENISLVYWDYYNTEYDHYVQQIKKNKLFNRPVYFAGGAWTWGGFAPNNTFSLETTAPAVEACVNEGVEGMFFTVWGDDGAECSSFAILPSLMFAAEKFRGNSDMDLIKAKFREIVGVEFDSFMLFDELGRPVTENGEITGRVSSKALLYNDPFMGIRDFKCSKEDYNYYKELAEKIRAVPEKGEFEHLFNAYEKLAEALSIKAPLGIKTREAYLAGDKEALGKMADEYALAAEKIRAFHSAHQARWFKDSKPHGFDVQDSRLGGVIQRALSCEARLRAYVNGEITEIPELLEPVLQNGQGAVAHWWKCITSNAITMHM